MFFGSLDFSLLSVNICPNCWTLVQSNTLAPPTEQTSPGFTHLVGPEDLAVFFAITCKKFHTLEQCRWELYNSVFYTVSVFMNCLPFLSTRKCHAKINCRMHCIHSVDNFALSNQNGPQRNLGFCSCDSWAEPSAIILHNTSAQFVNNCMLTFQNRYVYVLVYPFKLQHWLIQNEINTNFARCDDNTTKRV